MKLTLIKTMVVLSMVVGLAFAVPSTSSAEELSPMTLSWVAGGVGGGWYVQAGGIARMIAEKEPKLIIKVVPGGGVALVRCLAALDKTDAKGEEKIGIKLLKRALQEPLRQLAVNAGQEGSVVLNKVMEGQEDFGFNAATDTFENLLAAGVLDPAKVVRSALQNAASVAGLMLTTEAMIAEKPAKKKAPAMPAGGDMDDMY
jgi:chaperonin GroEL (HSP60 family)